MAGPIPYQITVNGEDFTLVRTRDDINPSWADEQSANSTLYSISGNTVVWENGGILQLNSVDVLPTDEILDTAYTTRQGGGTMSKSYDLSTSSKWSALSDGEHTVQIVAKGAGYRDSAKSTSVTVTKGGAGFTVSYVNNGQDSAPAYFKINGGNDTIITEASGTFENVETIQFSLFKDENYACTIKSTTLGINLSANSVSLSDTYTLTQDVSDIVISWQPARSR